MWHYQIFKHKDHCALVEYINMGGKIGWTDPILVGEDRKDIIDQLELMLLDCKNIEPMDYPQVE